MVEEVGRWRGVIMMNPPWFLAVDEGFEPGNTAMWRFGI